MERTKPLHQTEGPGDGRTWNQYFRDIKAADRAARTPDGDSDLAGTITVTQPAREVPEGEPIPRVLVTWRNRLLANQWRFKVGHSKAHHDDLYYLNGNLRKAAHDEEQWWINAKNGNTYLTISYNIEDGKPNSARTVRQVRGILKNLTDKELQEVIEG